MRIPEKAKSYPMRGNHFRIRHAGRRGDTAFFFSLPPFFNRLWDWRIGRRSVNGTGDL